MSCNHWSHITLTNTITTKFEIYQELPKCDRGTLSNCCWENGANDLVGPWLPQNFILQKHVCEVRWACVASFLFPFCSLGSPGWSVCVVVLLALFSWCQFLCDTACLSSGVLQPPGPWGAVSWPAEVQGGPGGPGGLWRMGPASRGGRCSRLPPWVFPFRSLLSCRLLSHTRLVCETAHLLKALSQSILFFRVGIWPW